MKKVIFILLASVLLGACGNDENGKGETAQHAPKESETNQSETKEAETKPVLEEVLTINKSEALVIEDYAEIIITANNFSQRIDPPNPGSFFTYYENEEDGEVYLDTVISIKSLLTSAKASNEFISVKVIYDDKYEYKTFSTIEKQGGSDFTYTNITSIEPLKTGELHFIASLPEQVENDGKPLKVVITVNGKDYEHTIR